MAVVVDSTVGGANSNSYISIAEFQALAELDAYGSEMRALTDNDVIGRLIITATTRIDYEKFDGEKSDLTTPQALAFPRTGLPTLDGIDNDGIIPQNIKEATYELAKYMHTTDISKPDTTNAPIEQVKAGSVTVKYKYDKNDNLTQPNNQLPSFVVYLLEPYAITVNSSSGVFYAYR